MTKTMDANVKGAQPVGTAPVVVVPLSKSKAAEKGATATLMAWGGLLLGLIAAALQDPTTAAVVLDLIGDNPKLVSAVTLLIFLSKFSQDMKKHASPESRMVVAEKPSHMEGAE